MKKKLLLLMCLVLAGIGGAWAINVGESVDLSSAAWTNKGGSYSTGYERYSKTSYTAGKILYRTQTDLQPGFYEVTFKAATNLAGWDGQTGSGYGIAQVYANWAVEDIEVIDQKSCTLDKSFTLTAYVDNTGTLEFGIRNIATGGCWYVLDNAATAKYVAMPGAYANTQNLVMGADFKGAANDNFPGFTIESNGGNRWKNGDHNVEYWNGTAANGQFKFYQELSGVPNGKYKVEASMFNSLNGVSTDTFGEGGQAGAFVTSNGQSYWALCSAEGTTLNAYSADAYVTNNTAQVGIGNKETMTARWFVCDYVKMYFVEPALSEYATAATSSTEATADTWYKLDVAVAGSYKVTSTADATFTYTTGNIASDASDSETLTAGTPVDLDLSAGAFYFKSSAAATITLAANSYSYETGSASADKAYIQPGQTVTVSYASAATNDPEATLAITTTGIQFNGSAVTAEATTNGFTFTVPNGLTAGADYTLEIPASCAKYGEKASSEAQNITLKTPAAYDGRYYMYNNDNKKYLSRGGNYATQAIVDEYGIAVVLTTDGEGNTDIKMFDSWLNIGYDGFVYTDTQGDNVRKFKMSKTENGIKFINTNNSATTNNYLAVHYGSVVADAREGDNLSGTSNVWTLENVNDHRAVVIAYNDTQAVTAATQSGMDVDDLGIEDKATLVNALTDGNNGYQSKSITITGTGGTVKENYQGGASSAQNSVPLAIFAEETVSNLKPGLYKLSVNAFQRATWLNDVLAAGGARGKVYVYANDAKTQIASISEYAAAEAYTGGDNPDLEVDGFHYPNNTTAAGTAFGNGGYVNDVFVYVPADEGETTGTLKFGIKNPTRLGNDGSRGAWTCFNNFTLTYYYKENLDDAYADLAAALTACEPWTESVEEDDYVDRYNTIYGYCNDRFYESTDDINQVIETLQTDFKTYAWDNANMDHPYDATAGVISNADIANGNDEWIGQGRSTANVTYYTGTSKTVFTQNHENGAARSQGIIIPNAGAYILRSYVKVPGDGFATIDLSGTSTTTTTTGNEGGDLGYGWVYNDIMFYTAADNTEKTISIALSNENNNRVAYFGETHLLYIGQNCDYAKNGIHYYMGNYTEAPSFVLTNEEPVVDATGASVTGASVTRTNANGIVYLASGSTADGGKNIVINGTCANLTLTDGSPVTIPTAFTATSATYNMTAIAGDKFGTLVLPFAATVPAEGKAYKLTGDVVMGDELTGVETSIEANKPVLVTKAGAYAGSGVEVAVTNAATTYTNGNLTGVYQATTAAEGIYVLQNHTATEGVAFYLVGSTKPTVNPFRAYIPAQTRAARAIKVKFSDTETAIDTLQEGNSDPIYDLSGRRVQKAQKGIYIKGGKKVMK